MLLKKRISLRSDFQINKGGLFSWEKKIVGNIDKVLSNGINYLHCILKLYPSKFTINFDKSNSFIYEVTDGLSMLEFEYGSILKIELEKKFFADEITITLNDNRSLTFRCWGANNLRKNITELINLNLKNSS